MDAKALERIRQAVEEGEVLSGPELDLLQAAAQSTPGPSLRLTVAHALMNAEHAVEALALLDVLRRDFPRELQVWLGLARAQMMLERFAEAERSLGQALRLNPGDPEAEKVLATLALRRGELARARRLVAHVLEVDPFDGEAQLLQSELDSLGSAAARPAGRPKADLQEFSQALMARLRAEATPYLHQGERLVLKLGRGGVARVDLKSLHAGYLEEELPLEAAVDGIARELSERSLGAPEDREALLGRVLPVLRDAEFVERAMGALHRDGPAGLLVYYVLDDAQLVRYLPEGLLPSRKVRPDEVDEAAFRNLAKRPGELRAVRLVEGRVQLSAQPTGLWAVAEADGHDPARLLLPAQVERVEQQLGPPPYRVYLGLRELVLLCREDADGWSDALAHLAPSESGIGGIFRIDQERRLARLGP